MAVRHNQRAARLDSLEASYRGMDQAYSMIALSDSGEKTSTIQRKKSGKIISDSLRLDINLSNEEDLVQLPGIGPTLARRIIEYRTQHGPFRKIDDLLEIKGIGKKTRERIRPYIYIKQ